MGDQMNKAELRLRDAAETVKLEHSPLARMELKQALEEMVTNLMELELVADAHDLSFLAFLLEMSLLETASVLDDLEAQAP